MLKDFVVALSIANLWFLDIWKLFLVRHSTAYPYYHWKVNAAPLLLATALDVLLLSCLLFLAITVARRSGKQSLLTIARLIFVLLCLLLLINLMLLVVRNPPLGAFVRTLKRRPQVLFEWQGINTINYWVATIIVLASWLGISLIVHSLIFRRQRLIKVLATIVLIISPFALITFTQAAMQWIRFQSGKQFQPKTVAALSQEHSSSPRILWIIFDELDARLGFHVRPDALKLPEFDRLRNESFFANNAYPPGGDTQYSLPALINGRLVSSINRTAPNELDLTYSDGKTSRWSAEPNIFSRARGMGFNTAVAGWYHPYCRVIGKDLTKCSWEAASLLLLDNSEIGDLLSAEDTGLAQNMLRISGSILPEITWFLFPMEPSEWRQHYFQEFNSIHQKALELAVDSKLNLILIHYPVPHPPGVYDRHKNEFSFTSSSGYLDNLALADRVLSELRKTMSEAGVWDTTTVLITSDHSLRAERVWKKHPLWESRFTVEDPSVLNSVTDDRIPFILKLAGENASLTYEPAFNAVLSHDLILAILSGEISKKEQVIAWVDRHRSITKSPYMSSER